MAVAKTLLIESTEAQINDISRRASEIHNKYQDINSPMNVKDIEDLKRYSEILRNLGAFLTDIYRW